MDDFRPPICGNLQMEVLEEWENIIELDGGLEKFGFSGRATLAFSAHGDSLIYPRKFQAACVDDLLNLS